VGDDTYTVEEGKTQVYDPSHGKNVTDLATMNNLAEGPLLDVLRRRYYNDFIYTFVGDILISFNPYVVIPGIYDIPPIPPAVISGTSLAVREDPHVFTVAERTYCDMMLNKQDQSIIVSGESGAGKTEACKR
jgi:myosin heavy subunit